MGITQHAMRENSSLYRRINDLKFRIRNEFSGEIIERKILIFQPRAGERRGADQLAGVGEPISSMRRFAPRRAGFTPPS